MRNIFYFGRKNHYGVRLIKDVKNMCDCVSGYTMRYYNVDTMERLGSSPNILAEKNYEPNAVILDSNVDSTAIALIKRLERTYQKGEIIINLSEPLRDFDTKKVSLKVVTKYNVSFDNGGTGATYSGDLDKQKIGTEFPIGKMDFLNATPELNLEFEKSHIGELDRIPDRANSMNGKAPKDESYITVEKITAFKLKVEYKVLTRMLYYDCSRRSSMIGYTHVQTLEQCRAQSFYFIVEGKTMRKEKMKFRFTLDKDGNLIEPPAGFNPISELPLAENPFLTADAVYESEEGDIPLYQWVAKNYLTKYKRIRKELEFEKALTPMYLTKEFYTDPEYRLDRPIRNGDYISITDEFGTWMGGTLGATLDQKFFDDITAKYDKEKAKEIADHPLIYRVMNTNTKIKNDVGYQKCECLEVINLDEIEEIFV
ncbi:MAG: hypothetical protein HFK07_01105 [Clostridia bacterium]|jgi:hypothetical protein|nr:hypothetical protein [Clostridia bacterium]MCX4367564.1 hypothetical protein [Clostridia bacterium]